MIVRISDHGVMAEGAELETDASGNFLCAHWGKAAVQAVELAATG
jgi:hypothetical protein